MKLYRALLNISYTNGTKCCIHCVETRDAYNAAYHIIRRWRFIESVEVGTGTVKLKMHIIREYGSGQYLVLTRGDGSVVSARALNGNRREWE